MTYRLCLIQCVSQRRNKLRQGGKLAFRLKMVMDRLAGMSPEEESQLNKLFDGVKL